jgi:hypothetical protein
MRIKKEKIDKLIGMCGTTRQCVRKERVEVSHCDLESEK